MMEDELLTGICAGSIVFLVGGLIAYLILSSRSYSISKRKEKGNVCLVISAKKNLNRITVVAKVGNEDITFERRRIRKGQTVEFVYPDSKKPARLVIENESGRVKPMDV